MKIYDAFLFFNELDLLEIRLEMLYEHVDYFIISECDSTFSGLKKPFYFDENKDKFQKFLDKIIHIKHHNSDNFKNPQNIYEGKKLEIFNGILRFYDEIKDSPHTDYGKGHWCRDFLHREYVKIGMADCQDDDVIIFSDLDEIPNPVKLKFDNNYFLNQKNMIYYLDRENITESWYGTFITKYGFIKNRSLGFTRLIKNQAKDGFTVIDNAGWHLTFMGGKQRVEQKLRSYGHQEFNNPWIINSIEGKLKLNSDILNRNIEIKKINLEDYYPQNLLSIVREKYRYLIHD